MLLTCFVYHFFMMHTDGVVVTMVSALIVTAGWGTLDEVRLAGATGSITTQDSRRPFPFCHNGAAYSTSSFQSSLLSARVWVIYTTNRANLTSRRSSMCWFLCPFNVQHNSPWRTHHKAWFYILKAALKPHPHERFINFCSLASKAQTYRTQHQST